MFFFFLIVSNLGYCIAQTVPQEVAFKGTLCEVPRDTCKDRTRQDPAYVEHGRSGFLFTFFEPLNLSFPVSRFLMNSQTPDIMKETSISISSQSINSGDFSLPETKLLCPANSKKHRKRKTVSVALVGHSKRKLVSIFVLVFDLLVVSSI
jgi:hypothetical protein